MYQIGDSAVHFAHVGSRDRTSSAGLRWLYRQRALAELRRDRLTCTLHVTREWNRASDALANGDMAKFEREIRYLLGRGAVLREVQVQDDSIAELVAFKLRR